MVPLNNSADTSNNDLFHFPLDLQMDLCIRQKCSFEVQCQNSDSQQLHFSKIPFTLNAFHVRGTNDQKSSLCEKLIESLEQLVCIYYNKAKMQIINHTYHPQNVGHTCSWCKLCEYMNVQKRSTVIFKCHFPMRLICPYKSLYSHRSCFWWLAYLNTVAHPSNKRIT